MKKKMLLFVYLVLLLLNSKIFSQPPAVQWQKLLGGTEDEIGYEIINSNNGGFIITGFANSSNGDVNNHQSPFVDEDFWLIKISNNGIIENNNCIGGSGGDESYGLSNTLDSGFIQIGYTSSHNGNVTGLNGVRDYWVVKSDSNLILEWQLCLGGSDIDEGREVVQTYDSGFYVIGYVSSDDSDVTGNHGGNTDDVWLAKINKTGSLQWSKCYGGTSYDDGESLAMLADGNILIAARTLSNDGDITGPHGGVDNWVVKVDTSGNIIWEKCYGGTGLDYPCKIIASSDNGFFLAATTSSLDGDVSGCHGQNDFWLCKCDSLGNIIWAKCFGGAYIEKVQAACLTSDGGIAMAGFASFDDGMVTGTHGSMLWDCWVVKVDSLGNFEWGKALGGNDYDEANGIIQSADGGYAIVGYSSSTDIPGQTNHGKKDLYVVKLAPPGLSVPENKNQLMDLSVFQNGDQLKVRFFSKHNQNVKMSFYDLDGRTVFTENIYIHEGINYQQIDCAGFLNGIYYFKIDGRDFTQGQKIIIEN